MSRAPAGGCPVWGVFIWIRRRQRPGGVFVWEWVRDMSVSSTIDLETDDATVGMDRTIFDLSTASYGFVGEAANDQSGYGVAGAGDVDGDGPRGLFRGLGRLSSLIGREAII